MLWRKDDETSSIVEKYPDIPWLFSRFEDDDDAAHKATRQPDQPVSPDAACILVVDDDLANLALAEALLQAEGFQVRVAVDGTSMFQMLKTCTPALILMDIQLPGMDGLEAILQLKANGETRSIPVIALTALAMKGDEARMRAAGCDDFVPKPYSPRQLLAKVRQYLV